MNFDVFDHAFPENSLILKQCKDAEKLTLTDPHDAIFNARAALERLCKDALKRINVPIPGTLSDMVKVCVEKSVFNNGTNAYVVRKRGNDIAHANPTKDFHTVKEENIRVSLKVMESLFCILSEISGVKNVQFDRHKIPFGIYDVVRKVAKAPSEEIVGDWHYFVKDASDDYFLLQVLPKKGADLGARNEAARKILKDQYKSQLLHTHNLTISPEADRQYVLYSVNRESFLLSERCSHMTPRQAVQVGMDLVKDLQELRENGIHHRNIQPGCVVLTPARGMFRADLVNMETAKIEESLGTVLPSIVKNFLDNPYMPKELRGGAAEVFTEWEKADVYAVAMVMIYCLDSELVSAGLAPDDLYDRFSDEMVDEVFRPIFESNVGAIFTLDEFGSMLEARIDGEENC